MRELGALQFGHHRSGEGEPGRIREAEDPVCASGSESPPCQNDVGFEISEQSGAQSHPRLAVILGGSDELDFVARFPEVIGQITQ